MKALRIFFSRFAALFRSGAAERDINAEIESHLDEATEDYIARGLSRDDARRAAMRDFGGISQTRQVHREARAFTWPDDVRMDVRYTIRRLIKDPVFTVIAIATLALGIGANTTIFALLDAVVFKPLPVPAPQELVTLYENGPEGKPDPMGGTGRYLRFSYPRFERLQQALGADGSLAAVTRSTLFVVRMPNVAQPQFVAAQLVSPGYFSTLGVPPAIGRLLDANDVRLDQEAAVAVVSDGFWKRVLGGTDAALGQTIVVNDVTARVVGVMPAGFFGMWSDSEPDLWMPITLQWPLRYRNNTSSYGRTDDDTTWLGQDLVAWVNLFARVPPENLARVKARLEAANQQGLKELAAAITDPASRGSMLSHTLAVAPFSHGFSGLRERYSGALFALTGLVALVLFVTCANIANLLLARGAKEARDMGIRVSLGASTARLVQQRLIESLTLALAGGAAGLLFGNWSSAFLAREVLGRSGQLPSVFSPDSRVVIFAAGVSVITAIVFGVAPAFRAVTMGRKTTIVTTQRIALGQVTTKGMRSLVVGQLALSVVIVFASVLLGRTLINFMRIDPGFSIDRLVTVSLDSMTSGYKPPQIPALSQKLLETVRGLPGVVSASSSMCGLIAGCSSTGGFSIEGAGASNSVRQNWISADYFRTAAIPVLSGREFTDRDSETSAPVAIVNETLARRYFPGQNAVGRHVGAGQPKPDIEIVGVVRDARTQSLHDLPDPMVYLPVGQWGNGNFRAGFNNVDLRVSGDPAAVIPSVRAALKEAFPNLLVRDVTTISARLRRDLNRERVVAYLAFSFGGLTLLLASLGLYGVLSYGVAQRTQEIGVRMALGARRVEVLMSVLGQSARLTLVGIILGLIATAAAAGSLASMLYGVTPLDPSSFVVVVVIFWIVTTLAAYIPARRATKVDPLVALRYE